MMSRILLQKIIRVVEMRWFRCSYMWRGLVDTDNVFELLTQLRWIGSGGSFHAGICRHWTMERRDLDSIRIRWTVGTAGLQRKSRDLLSIFDDCGSFGASRAQAGGCRRRRCRYRTVLVPWLQRRVVVVSGRSEHRYLVAVGMVQNRHGRGTFRRPVFRAFIVDLGALLDLSLLLHDPGLLSLDESLRLCVIVETLDLCPDSLLASSPTFYGCSAAGRRARFDDGIRSLFD